MPFWGINVFFGHLESTVVPWLKISIKPNTNCSEYTVHKNLEAMQSSSMVNKPELATMRPDYVSACIDHVTYMDGKTDRRPSRVVMEALETCLSLSRFSVGSHRGQKQPKNVVFAQL